MESAVRMPNDDIIKAPNATWYTAEGRFHPEYRMPLVCRSGALFHPDLGGSVFQLLLLIEGSLILGAEGKTYCLHAPELFCARGVGGIAVLERKRDRAFHAAFLPSIVNAQYTDQALIPATPSGNFVEDIEYSLFAPFASEKQGITRYSVAPQAMSRLKGLFTILASLLAGPADVYWPCRSRSYLLEILSVSYRLSLAGNAQVELTVETGTRIDEIVSYLHTHYEERLHLESLAGRFATNRTTLNKWFREHFDESVMNYLAKVRIGVACNLLRNTLLPVSEVIERCGFRDAAQFWRTFKKNLGVNPSDYRKSFPSPYAFTGDSCGNAN